MTTQQNEGSKSSHVWVTGLQGTSHTIPPCLAPIVFLRFTTKAVKEMTSLYEPAALPSTDVT